MKKTYVLDTNVLIQAPYAVECFEENTVVLPMTVLEELDNMKKEEGRKRCQCTQSDSDFGRTQRKRKFAGRGAYGMGRDSACRKKLPER